MGHGKVKTGRVAADFSARLPGMSIRNFSGPEDYELMAALMNAQWQQEGELRQTSAEKLRHHFETLDRVDVSKDILFVEKDGEAVGYGRCDCDIEQNQDYLYDIAIHLNLDQHRDGIPEALFGRLQNRVLEMAGEDPGEAPKFLQSWGRQDQNWHEDLMQTFGLLPVRYIVHMLRPSTLPVEVTPLPAELVIRSARPDEYRKVYTTEVEIFRDLGEYVPPTESEYQRFLTSPLFDPALWKLAWSGDELVGMVLNFIDHQENQALKIKRGYTEDICVRPAWRRKGVARSLLTQSIQMFQEMGMDETFLGVDTQNPHNALKLYESVGYREIKRKVVFRRPI